MSDPVEEFLIHGVGCSPAEECLCDFEARDKALEHHKKLTTELTDHKDCLKSWMESHRILKVELADWRERAEKLQDELAEEIVRIAEVSMQNLNLAENVEQLKDELAEGKAKINELAKALRGCQTHLHQTKEELAIVRAERDVDNDCKLDPLNAECGPCGVCRRCLKAELAELRHIFVVCDDHKDFELTAHCPVCVKFADSQKHEAELFKMTEERDWWANRIRDKQHFIDVLTKKIEQLKAVIRRDQDE